MTHRTRSTDSKAPAHSLLSRSLKKNRVRSFMRRGLGCAFFWLLPSLVHAQERGLTAVVEAKRNLGVQTRALMIAAHPDDENNRILTWLARGHGVTTAYLSLTRGDGGQNLIGNELGEALGVIRTQELLAARRIDGAHQYFTRAYDFGFSKNAEETYKHWPKDSILGDVVKIVRAFKPHIIIAQFSGTRGDGHGQHEVSGLLAREVFESAAMDTSRFPADKFGEPWTPLKFYGRNIGTPTIRINVGEYNPTLGRSYGEIADESRSQHRSQGFGTLQRKGVSWLPLTRGMARVGPENAADERTIFDGIDTARVVTDSARSVIAFLESGVAIDAVASRENVALGDSVDVTTTVYNRGTSQISVVDPNLNGGTPVPVAPDSQLTWKSWAYGRAITQPWWLQPRRIGDLFFPKDITIAEDEREKREWKHVGIVLPGLNRPKDVRVPVVYRFQDRVRGEVRRPVFVVPGLTIFLNGNVAFSRAGVPVTRAVTATVRSAYTVPVVAMVALNHDSATFRVDTATHTVTIQPGGVQQVHFVISGKAPKAGEYAASVTASIFGQTFDKSFQAIEYEHIEPQRRYFSADLQFKVIDVQLPPQLRVGYIQGVGDNVWGVLDQLDVQVTPIPLAAIATVSLAPYNVIVVGPRAYEVHPELIDYNTRLLTWVRNGGRLVVQYGQQEMTRPGLMPYPITIASPHDRVTEEDAPVRILAPTSALLRFPNRIGESDFKGWVQERSLYMPRTFDPHYKTVLSMSDPNEPSNDASILITPFGKGTYVYTTIAFFRQLPQGVSGATRLFMNLLAPQNK
jgi:LmbE family N-acetylglucosaminyl deacetylase